MSAPQTSTKPAPQFIEIEAYEKMLIQRDTDPRAFLMQHSINERAAAEYYERAKRKAESARG